MTKLYELTSQYRNIAKLLDYDYAEQLDIEGTLKNISDEFDDKALNVAKIYKELLASKEAIKTEVDRLSKRIKAIDNDTDFMKQYLLTEMLTLNKTEISDNVINIKVQKNPPSVDIIDENEIDNKFKKYIPESYETKKSMILDHFNKTGEIPSGVDIITDKKHIVIR